MHTQHNRKFYTDIHFVSHKRNAPLIYKGASKEGKLMLLLSTVSSNLCLEAKFKEKGKVLYRRREGEEEGKAG